MSRLLRCSVCLILAVLPPACGSRSSEAAIDSGGGPRSGAAPAPALPAGLFVAEAPEGAVPVAQVRRTGRAGDRVVVHARIGGRRDVFVDSRAVFVAIDPSLTSCIEEEDCPTPWDYCCTPPETLTANTIAVQVVDGDGVPLKGSLAGVHGLTPLAELVVAGSLRSAGGSLVLDAERIHVVPGGSGR